MNIRDEFRMDVLKAINECHIIDYNPSRYESMIEISHPVEVAIKLVTASDIQYGFEKLISLGRRDLTIEYIMLKDKYKDLFSKSYLEAAKWRLDQALSE